MMESKFIINLFGMGIRYWICEIPIPLYEEMNKIRLNHKVEWENLLFDFDFLNHYGFSHWCELSAHPEHSGFLLDLQNRIEIKQGAKFIARFRANALLNEDTLFPLYQTVEIDFPFSTKPGFQTLILIQFEKGLIAKFKFESNVFSMDNLSFRIYALKHMNFLSAIDLNQSPLESDSNDTVATGCLVIKV